MKKYRWLIMGAVAALLFVLSIIMFFATTLAEEIILYFTAALVIVFAVVRFVPLMRHLDSKPRLILNALEIFSNVLLAVGMILIAIKYPDQINLFKYMVALILVARGVIFLTEGVYFGAEKEVPKFIAHIVFLMIGSAIVAVKDFNLENLIFVIGVLALLVGLYSTADAGVSFNKYRKTYGPKSLENEKADEAPAPQPQVQEQVILDDQPVEQPYVS